MSAARSPAVKVDYDIIVAIIKSLEGDGAEGRRTILALSQTCKYLRQEGVKSLLAHDFLLGGGRIESFCDLILADPTARGPLLRTLDIAVATIPRAAVTLMVIMLQYTRHLTHLKIRYLGYLSQPAARDLCAAFASLTSLKELVLFGLSSYPKLRSLTATRAPQTEYFAMLLRELRSPLLAVELALPPLPSHVAYRDPIVLLSSFRSTLESVTLTGDVSLGKPPGDCVFPHVTRLCLPEQGVPHVQSYIRSFPNVRHIRFGGVLHPRYPARVYVLDEPLLGFTRQEWHDRNIQYQWPAIDFLRATVLDAYSYGISCSVTSMHLMTVGGDHDTELEMLSSIFAMTHPSVVRLALKVWSGRDSLPVLPPSSPLVYCLTSLELRINVTLQVFDFATYIHHVINMIQSFHVIRTFRLEFRCSNCPRRDGEELRSRGWVEETCINGGLHCQDPSDFGESAICYMREAIQKLDLREHVRAIAAASMTLRQAFVLWRRCYAEFGVPPVPDRVVGMDLDNVPHSVDRYGDCSDVWSPDFW